MKAYLAIKFHEDSKNRKLIEDVCAALSAAGIETIVLARDHEKWGAVRFEPAELMKKTFKLIDSCDILIVEFSEKGIGLGIEAGYAHAKGKAVYVIAKQGSEISDTLRGIAKEIVFYNKPEELKEKMRHVAE